MARVREFDRIFDAEMLELQRGRTVSLERHLFRNRAASFFSAPSLKIVSGIGAVGSNTGSLTRRRFERIRLGG